MEQRERTKLIAIENMIQENIGKIEHWIKKHNKQQSKQDNVKMELVKKWQNLEG